MKAFSAKQMAVIGLKPAVQSMRFLKVSFMWPEAHFNSRFEDVDSDVLVSASVAAEWNADGTFLWAAVDSLTVSDGCYDASDLMSSDALTSLVEEILESYYRKAYRPDCTQVIPAWNVQEAA